MLLLSLFACTTPDPDSGTDSQDTGTPVLTCEDGLPMLDWTEVTDAPTQRWDMAQDFTVTLLDGTTWSYREHFNGCDSVIILPYGLKNFDRDSLWEDGVSDLIANSPRNVYYVFITEGLYDEDVAPIAQAHQARVDEALAELSAEDAEWWASRMLVLGTGTKTLTGWMPDMLGDRVGSYGLGIDRFQQVRGLGSAADVRYYDGNVGWFDGRLLRYGHEPAYFNFEANRAAEMAQFEATTVRFWDGEVLAEYEDITIELPAADAFDTLEIDVLMECPDPDKAEFNNCGAWDYLVHFYLLDQDGETWHEVARFITTYHRESRWVVDASHALPWINEGGEYTFRYSFAPSWNTQPTGVTFDLRYTDQGKGMRPTETHLVATGGSFNSAYNDERVPVSVDIPADAKHVELRALTTGHGMDTNNCAEFCEHEHVFSAGGSSWTQDFPAVGDQEGCSSRSGDGVVPNQGGTWWYGRGGWCPGEEVTPWVVDLDDVSDAGQPVEVSYAGQYKGGAIPDASGNIVLNAWVVVYE